MKHIFLISIAVALSLASCGNKTMRGSGGDTIKLKYSSLLNIIRYRHYTKVDVADPWHKDKILRTYILADRQDSSLLNKLPAGTVVYTPVKRAVIFNSAYCKLLQSMQSQDAISGVCDLKYIVNPEIHNLVKAGKIIDCGNGLMPMTEKIIALNPQALLIPPFDNSGGHGKLEQLGVPIIECADYMETSPLARAEWIKFYGLLFGCEQRADSLFNVVDSSYISLRKTAAKLPRGRSIITERKTGSVWYCPGGMSTTGRIIADANGNYSFSEDNHSGSLALSFEEVLEKAGNADVWTFVYESKKPLSRSDLIAEYRGYSALKAFKTGEIYECGSFTRPYFDEIAFRPDYLLREFILILHPQVNSKLRYYRKL